MRWSFVNDGIFLTRHHSQFTDTACHRSTQASSSSFFSTIHLRIQGIHQIILPTNGFGSIRRSSVFIMRPLDRKGVSMPHTGATKSSVSACFQSKAIHYKNQVHRFVLKTHLC
jgi:hypothetical protein